eukprot:gene11823-15822_t
MSDNHLNDNPSERYSYSIHGYVTKGVVIDPGEDDEDEEDYEDIKMEMMATGHNLTAVLINPRETFLENIFDDFTIEQSAPLEYNSPLVAALNGANGNIKGSSLHTSIHNLSMGASSISSLSSPASTAALFTLTNSENDQLERFLARMKQLFKLYNAIHNATEDDFTYNNQNKSSPRMTLSNPTGIKLKKVSADELRQCYREVPPLFFRPDFSLQNQEIFNVAFNIKGFQGSGSMNENKRIQSGDITTTPNGSKICTFEDYKNFERQEALSYYLDITEVALLRQIWARSPAFFRALDDIKGLQYQVSEATKYIKQIRTKIQMVDELASFTAMRIPKMYQRQKNEALLQDKLLYMQQVAHGRASIIALLEVEDYMSALELISSSRKIYSNHLTGINCMRKIGDQLDDFDNLVCEVMCNKFVSIAIQWEETSIRIDGVDTYNNNNNLTQSQRLTQETLKQLLESLVATERLPSALAMYKQRLLEAIRLIIRTCVMEYLQNFDPSLFLSDENSNGTQDDLSIGMVSLDNNSNNNSSNEAPFAQRIKEMTAENFLSCMAMCFEHVILSLEKAKIFHLFLENNLNLGHQNQTSVSDNNVNNNGNINDNNSNSINNNNNNNDSKNNNDNNRESITRTNHLITHMISLSKSCLTGACELAQRSITQIINLRKEANSKLTVDKMKFLWEISLQFVLSVEEVSGSTAYIIRQCLLLQTKSFLAYSHESFKGKLVNALDNERWVQCDISFERQAELERLSSGRSFLPNKQLSNNSSIHQDTNNNNNNKINSSLNNNPSLINGTTNGNFKRNREIKPVIIDGTEYKVVWSVMLLNEQILTYLDIAFNFPPVTTTDIIHMIIELLRLFDQRTHNLVLGAQAIQSAARLKSISAKHLAVTGQSIGLAIAILPHIRAALLAQIPPKQQLLLMELDRVSQELIDHHSQIVAK